MVSNRITIKLFKGCESVRNFIHLADLSSAPDGSAYCPMDSSKERDRDWTMEEVCPSFPSWMKPTMKEERSLSEGLEKASWNQDKMNRTSCLAWGIRIGCSPFQANSLYGYYFWVNNTFFGMQCQ